MLAKITKNTSANFGLGSFSPCWVSCLSELISDTIFPQIRRFPSRRLRRSLRDLRRSSHARYDSTPYAHFRCGPSGVAHEHPVCYIRCSTSGAARSVCHFRCGIYFRFTIPLQMITCGVVRCGTSGKRWSLPVLSGVILLVNYSTPDGHFWWIQRRLDFYAMACFEPSGLSGVTLSPLSLSSSLLLWTPPDHSAPPLLKSHSCVDHVTNPWSCSCQSKCAEMAWAPGCGRGPLGWTHFTSSLSPESRICTWLDPQPLVSLYSLRISVSDVCKLFWGLYSRLRLIQSILDPSSFFGIVHLFLHCGDRTLNGSFLGIVWYFQLSHSNYATNTVQLRLQAQSTLGRQSTHTFAGNSFDVACVQCVHSHLQQQAICLRLRLASSVDWAWVNLALCVQATFAAPREDEISPDQMPRMKSYLDTKELSVTEEVFPGLPGTKWWVMKQVGVQEPHQRCRCPARNLPDAAVYKKKWAGLCPKHFFWKVKHQKVRKHHTNTWRYQRATVMQRKSENERSTAKRRKIPQMPGCN